MPPNACRRSRFCNVFLTALTVHTVAGNRVQRRALEDSRKQENSQAEFPFADATGCDGLASSLMTSIPASAFTLVGTPHSLSRAFAHSSASRLAQRGALQMNAMNVAEFPITDVSHTPREIPYVDCLEEFYQAISSPRLTVVDFAQTLCGACNSAEAMFLDMSEEYQGVDFYKALGDHMPMKAVMIWQGVKLLPSFGLYKNGRMIALISGKEKEANLREAIEASLA